MQERALQTWGFTLYKPPNTCKASDVTEKERDLLFFALRQASSIGYAAHPEMAFEAAVMIEQLQQIRKVLQAIQKRIQKLCLRFPQVRYLLSTRASAIFWRAAASAFA